jgi:hypothetical protein
VHDRCVRHCSLRLSSRLSSAGSPTLTGQEKTKTTIPTDRGDTDGVSDKPVLSRRVLLLGAACSLMGTTGCSTGSSPATPQHAPASSLPSSSVWLPGPGEISPDVKRRAVELIEALAAWPREQQGATAARQRVAALGLDPGLIHQASPLLADAPEATVHVIDAQYGGILPASASVLVVCEQWLRASTGTVTAGGTTVDVRLEQAHPRWQVSALHPAEPGPAISGLPWPGSQVLTNGRIHLPAAAEADVKSGNVHTSVLQALQQLSQEYVLAVSVIRSGHPLEVFGTDRPSDHPRGRAVDVWAINGEAVVEPATSPELVDGFMRRAAAVGSYNVGGPRQLEGPQFFSDQTHHDHVHLGFLT